MMTTLLGLALILTASAGGSWLGRMLAERDRTRDYAQSLLELRASYEANLEKVERETAERIREKAAQMIEHQFNCNRQRERDGLPKSWGCSYCDVADKVRELR